ncbi:hypothetical protein PSI17_14750 [Xenorhabdus sp. IM139775]|nr:hypothetical protein [Xenorhabdus sp. IM139775]MDC9594826.1 hypothetical protein [Xenorhabdus sp. IM139775]
MVVDNSAAHRDRIPHHRARVIQRVAGEGHTVGFQTLFVAQGAGRQPQVFPGQRPLVGEMDTVNGQVAGQAPVGQVGQPSAHREGQRAVTTNRIAGPVGVILLHGQRQALLAEQGPAGIIQGVGIDRQLLPTLDETALIEQRQHGRNTRIEIECAVGADHPLLIDQLVEI